MLMNVWLRKVVCDIVVGDTALCCMLVLGLGFKQKNKVGVTLLYAAVVAASKDG